MEMYKFSYITTQWIFISTPQFFLFFDSIPLPLTKSWWPLVRANYYVPKSKCIKHILFLFQTVTAIIAKRRSKVRYRTIFMLIFALLLVCYSLGFLAKSNVIQHKGRNIGDFLWFCFYHYHYDFLFTSTYCMFFAYLGYYTFMKKIRFFSGFWNISKFNSIFEPLFQINDKL